MDHARIVHAMEDVPGRHLDCVYDAAEKRYLIPANMPKMPVWLRMLSFLSRCFVREQMKVAILDTGLLSRHPWLRRRIVDAVDFTGEGPEDRNGHGTAVALVLLHTAPGARLLNVKVLDEDKSGTEEDLIEGLRWAESHGAGMINLSLGITRTCAGNCTVCREASRLVQQRGIIVVAAAGNEGPSCPAQAEGVISSAGSPMVEFKPLRRWGFL